jgi:hypothetical protein
VRLAIIPGFVAAYVLAMLVLQGAFHMNSILVATLVNLAVAASMTVARRDLLAPAVVTALLVGLLAAAGYAIGLDVIVDGNSVLRRIWLVSGTALGVTVLGNVPLTEIVWYASWSAMTSIGYEYVAGARLRPALPARKPPDRSASGRPERDVR